MSNLSNSLALLVLLFCPTLFCTGIHILSIGSVLKTCFTR